MITDTVEDNDIACEYFENSRLSFIEECKAKGLQIIEPGSREIQLDIDDEDSYLHFRSCMHMELCWKESSSTTPGHHHITVYWPEEISLRSRCLIATILGSDIKREKANMTRIDNRTSYPVIFIEGGSYK